VAIASDAGVLSGSGYCDHSRGLVLCDDAISANRLFGQRIRPRSSGRRRVRKEIPLYADELKPVGVLNSRTDSNRLADGVFSNVLA
jgi:hypothetical protein